jgi:hypothetical protein
MGNGAQRIPSWPGALAPTKAEYICADQPVTLTFRLRQGGGPYMPGKLHSVILHRLGAKARLTLGYG